MQFADVFSLYCLMFTERKYTLQASFSVITMEFTGFDKRKVLESSNIV